MAITVTLTANPDTGAGVNFNAGYAAFFADFAPYQLPLFMEPTGSTETTQIMHLDTPVEGAEPDTRAVLLEGDDFLYTFSNHSVSGTIDTIRLVTLGDAYDSATGDLVTDGGLVTDASGYITFSGLGITNAAGVKGEVHAIVAGLMGGGMNGVLADATPITTHIFGEGHILIGSTGGDTYTGTAFNDRISGFAGADTLSGAAGRDRIDGGNGVDVLTGGGGRDVFVFRTVAAARGDTITDFSGDVIDLHLIDANTTATGNQAFTYIDSARFHNIAGELRLQGGVLLGDTNGDGKADLRLNLTDITHLTADDFTL